MFVFQTFVAILRSNGKITFVDSGHAPVSFYCKSATKKCKTYLIIMEDVIFRASHWDMNKIYYSHLNLDTDWILIWKVNSTRWDNKILSDLSGNKIIYESVLFIINHEDIASSPWKSICSGSRWLSERIYCGLAEVERRKAHSENTSWINSIHEKLQEGKVNFGFPKAWSNQISMYLRYMIFFLLSELELEKAKEYRFAKNFQAHLNKINSFSEWRWK